MLLLPRSLLGFGVMKAQSVRFQWQNVDVQMTESANY